MRSLRVLFGFLAALVLLAPAYAHEGMEHVPGMAKAVDDKTITVETAGKKEVVVAFDDKTTFEKGGKPATAKDLAVGEKVVVHAKKGPDGALKAAIVKFGKQPTSHTHEK